MGTPKPRLYFIDNLRLMVIALVVMFHLAIIVSGLGGFYYVHGQPMGRLSLIWFAFFLSFQQGYFMGLLFLLAGYFVPRSLERRGFSPFVGERFKRLIIPAILTMVLISPFINIIELGKIPNGFNLYDFLSGTGVLWFTVALFIFSFVYAVLRLIVPRSIAPGVVKTYTPKILHAVGLILLIAVVAFLLRIVQPLGTNILNMQIGYFSQYIILFIVGTQAQRYDLFSKITYRAAKGWLFVAIVPGFLLWLLMVGIVTRVSGGSSAFAGGVTWENAAFALWESFIAVAMDIGLIGVFREKFNVQTAFVKALSDSSFTVYMFHPVFIVAIGLLFSSVSLPAFPKWIIMLLISLPLCFAAAYYVFRRVPLLNRVL